jgi:hypothetical protein
VAGPSALIRPRSPLLAPAHVQIRGIPSALANQHALASVLSLTAKWPQVHGLLPRWIASAMAEQKLRVSPTERDHELYL